MTSLTNQKSPTLVCIGPGVLDVRVMSDPDVFQASKKVESHFDEKLGGGCHNTALAAKQSGIKVIPILLTGNDDRKNAIHAKCNKKFERSLVLPILEESRLSVLCGETCVTVRPHIVTPILSTEASDVIRQADWTLIAPMTAKDSGFVHSVLERGRHTVLQLSSGQLECREETVYLARKATWVVINRSELKIWSGEDDVASGLKWLRTQGVGNAIVTGASEIGVLFKSTHADVLSFPEGEIPGSSIGAGDHFTGTFAANLALHGNWKYAIANAHSATTKLLSVQPAVPKPAPNVPKLESFHWRHVLTTAALFGGLALGLLV